MTVAVVVVAQLGCVFILFIGARFLLAPRVAMAGFGVPEDSLRALTSIKGVRASTSGGVPVVGRAAAGHQAFGWALLAAAITPIGDAVIVSTNKGTVAHA